MPAVDLPQVVPPPYVPELNPVARFFAEVRRAIEGRHYRTLREKQRAVTAVLRPWRDEPARIRQRCGWVWIRDALTALPARETMA